MVAYKDVTIREAVFFHRASKTLVVTDAVARIPYEVSAQCGARLITCSSIFPKITVPHTYYPPPLTTDETFSHKSDFSHQV